MENNLDKTSSEIIKGILKKNNISRTTLEERFRKICILEDGASLSPATYIKRRQNQIKILNRSREKGVERKFDVSKILGKLKKLNIAQKYGFINVQINAENYWENYIDFNYKKILDFIFGGNQLICIGDTENSTIEDVLEYNKSLINERDFYYFYCQLIPKINNINYIGFDTEWIVRLFLKRDFIAGKFNYYINEYIYEDLNKYKTIFNKAKDVLGNANYQKSIEEVNNDKRLLNHKEKVIFNAISDIESGKFENIKLSNIISDCLEKGIFKTENEGRYTVITLLLKGLIYIEQV